MYMPLVLTDGSAQAADLPAGSAAVEVICGVVGSTILAVVLVVRPSPDTLGAGVGLKGGILGGRRAAKPAADAVAVFLSCNHLRRAFADLPVLADGPGREGQRAPLTSDYDQIITTIAGQLSRAASSGCHRELTGGTHCPEVR